VPLRPLRADHPLAARYLRPEGPWDGPALDLALAASVGGTAASATGGRALVVDGHERLDAAALARAVGEVAGSLRAQGVGPGEVVCWQRPNSAGALVLVRACWRLGAVAAPIHHLASPTEAAAIVRRIEPSLVVEDALRAPAAASVPLGEVDVDPASAAVVLFTSGSTGRPKGVVHSHRALAGKARTMVDAHGLTADDVVLMPAPLAHVSGLLNGVLLPGVLPMEVVLMDRWDPAHALDLIEAEGVTFMVGPPTFFLGLLDAPTWSAERTASLRLISCGGTGVTPAFAEDTARRLGAVVKRSYGSTEAPTVTTSRPGDPPERGWSTEGSPVGDAEVRISPSGEVEVRGPEVLAGYLDEEDEQHAFSPDGERWLRMGDLGTLHADGSLVITGRAGDVIIRGGENITAAEVESVLEAHPLVRQAVAVGQPDDRLGERVAAFVVAAGPFDLATCREWCAEQGLARFKLPERVEVVEELPLLPAGKPDRRALEQRLRSG
jgi:cyclohexanecarboxylate-CoA ligase